MRQMTVRPSIGRINGLIIYGIAAMDKQLIAVSVCRMESDSYYSVPDEIDRSCSPIVADPPAVLYFLLISAV